MKTYFSVLSWWLFSFCGWPLQPLREIGKALWYAIGEVAVAVFQLSMIIFWPLVLALALCRKRFFKKMLRAKQEADSTAPNPEPKR